MKKQEYIERLKYVKEFGVITISIDSVIQVLEEMEEEQKGLNENTKEEVINDIIHEVSEKIDSIVEDYDVELDYNKRVVVENFTTDDDVVREIVEKAFELL